MNYPVGSAQDLTLRTKDLNNLFLVRAINDFELEELAARNPESFYFHTGTLYERVCGNMIAKHGRLRSGTVIVYTPLESDFGPNDAKFELSESFVTCKRDFFGPVEVYNIRGFDWEGIREYLRKYGPSRQESLK